MTVLGALARGTDQSRTIQASAWGSWDSESASTWSGSKVTSTSALQLLTVYGCNRFICDGISTLPVDVRRGTSTGARDVDTPQWLRQPTPELDFIAWAGQIITSWLLAGDVFVVPQYGDGGLRYVTPLDPAAVTIKRVDGRKMFDVNGDMFDTTQIIHVPGIMWPGSDRGLSPVEYARQGIGMGLAAQEYGARFFDQDSTPGGVIEVPGELTPGQARDMARSWKKKHGGKNQNGLPGVLQGGAVWKQTSVTNDQAQFLETRQFTAAEIAASMFLIDPPEMGIGVAGQSLTYANLEQRNARKVQVTFLPWIVRLEALVSRLLPRPQYMKLNVNGLLRGDTKTRFESYGIAIDKQFMVPNEARDFEDWSPLAGGDAVVKPKPPQEGEPNA